VRLDITVRQRWRELMHGLYPSADLRDPLEQVDWCLAIAGSQEHRELLLRT